MRALIIEPDSSVSQAISLVLRSEGFTTDVADYGEEGVDLAKLYDFDVILSEVALPDMRAMEVLRQVRAAKVRAPILATGYANDPPTRIEAYRAGADHYLSKPFHKAELVIVARSLVLRSRNVATPVIECGAISIDVASKVVKVDGRKVHLTGKEYAMLELLALRRGQTLSKEVFMDHLYGGRDEPEPKIVDVFICKLRRKLGDAGKQVETTWGTGYVLRDAPSETAFAGRPLAPPPKHSLTGRILARLRAGSASFDQLAALRGESSILTVRGTLSRLKAEDQVENVGEHGHAVYRLKRSAEALAG